MKLAIVGAGLTGLSAAYSLREFANVTVFERGNLGGLASAYCPSYCIEKFYHHCFRRDSELLRLISELGLSKKLVWRVARVGQEYRGKIYPLNTPLEILKYPGMSLTDKVKLAVFTLKCKNRSLEEFKRFDGVRAVDGIKKDLGERLLNSFFLPLLRSKFGDLYSEVSYAWLLARVAIRSNRKSSGEELGYLRHGFQQLIDRLVEEISDCEFRREEVRKVEKRGHWIVNRESFDAVIWTTPIPVLESVNPALKAAAGLKDIRYQSSICVLLASEKDVTDDIYWSNVNCTFGAIIEHTHFMPLEDYGEKLIYLAGYTYPDSKLMKMEEKEVIRLYLKDLEKFGIRKEDVKWAKLFREKYSGPVYETGYLKKMTPYRTGVKGFYVAGMTSEPNYPERSMNGSVKAGREVADKLVEDFGL